MSRDLSLVAYPHPFKRTPVVAAAPEGMSVAEILGDAHDYVQVVVDGEYLPRERWSLRPSAGQVIEIRALPAGDDDTARLVGTMLVMAASIYVPQALAMAPFPAALASAAISIAGTLALNALLPPPELNQDAPNRLKGLTGTRNALNPYGVMPRPFGTVRSYPVVVGKPYTEIIGNDQYLRMLFLVGVGEFDLSALRIGETALDKYADITVISNPRGTLDSSYGGIAFQDDPLRIYGRDVDEQPLSDQLTSSDGPVSVTRTTALNSVGIGVDFVLPLGLVQVESDGDKRSIGISLRVEISVAGQNLWTDVAAINSGIDVVLGDNIRRVNSESDGTVFMIYGKTLDTIRTGLSVLVAEGQYDVRITPLAAYRNGIYPNGAEFFSFEPASTSDAPDAAKVPWDLKGITLDMIWAVLRAWQPGTPVAQEVVDNCAVVSMRIRATEQLNGVVDQFSLITTARLRTWDGAAWTAPVATRNPAWAYVEALTGVANPRPLPLSMINATEVKAWADWCDANGFFYDSRGDRDLTVFELIREITAAGKATWAIRDGLYTVVRDEASPAPVQMFTPRNSWGFSSSKKFLKLPHALKVKFLNPDADYADDVCVVYADGYSVDGANNTAVATEFEDLDLPGVANYDQAWRLGRYYLAAAQLRPEIYQLNVDIENLVCSRGSMVRVVHDVPLWGSGWGRVKTVTIDGNGDVVSFVSDEVVAMDGVSSYSVTFRKPDGEQVSANVVVATGEVTQIDLITPVSGVSEGDLFAFGTPVDLLVTRIDPGPDLTATLSLVDAAPDIHLADVGVIPPFNTFITEPLDIDNIAPPVPVISQMKSDETVLIRDADGALRIRMVAYYTFSQQVGLPGLQIEMRYRPATGDNPWQSVGPMASRGQISATEVEELETYEVQLRAVNGAGVSGWSSSWQHKVEGKTNVPADVTGFAYALEPAGVRLSWDKAPDRDVVGYILRLGAETIEEISALTYLWKAPPAGTHELWVVATDGVRESAVPTPLMLVINAPAAPVVSAAVAGGRIVLSWQVPTSDFPIASYRIKEGATYATAVVIEDEIKATSWEVDVNFSGGKTYWVEALDSAGNYGTAGSADVTISAPGSVDPSYLLDSGFAILQWNTPASSLPISSYVIKRGSDWNSSLLVDTRLANSVKLTVDWSGPESFMVAAVDSAGNLGTITTIAIDVSPPAAISLTSSFSGDSVLLEWSAPASDLPIEGYLIKEGNDWATGIELATAKTTSFSIKANWAGTKRFQVAAINSAGFEGGVGSVDVVVQRPGKPAVTSQVVDNNVLLYWSAAQGSLPIQGFEVRKGADFAMGEVVGEHSGTFSPLFETDAGSYIYWVVAIDSAGNYGTEASITVSVNEPPDYVLKQNWRSDFSGSRVNTAITADGSLLVPVDTTVSWQDRFNNNGWGVPQDQINAGFPYYMMPSLATASYEEEFDYGSVLSGTLVSLNVATTPVAGTVTMTTTISLRASTTDPWVDYADVSQVYGTNFRYVKVRLDFSATGGDDLLAISQLELRLDVKRKYDGGMATASAADANGTWVAFNRQFIDVDSITITPAYQAGIDGIVGLYDFTDAPYPTGMYVYLYRRSDGTRISGDFSWSVEGL